MIFRSWVIATLLAIGVTSLPAASSQVQGRVRLIGPPEGLKAGTIVYAEPLDIRPSIRLAHYKMIQRNKAFMPRVLAVPMGSTVDFRNEDLIFHNVFSFSRPNPFDLGLYRAGLSKSQVFTEPATYRVFCNIHPQMTAVILVVPTSFITETGADGSYRLDLPRGRYHLTAWSERSPPATTEIVVSGSTLTVPEFSLDESNYQETPHKNKYGQDYSPTNYDSLRGPGGQ